MKNKMWAGQQASTRIKALALHVAELGCIPQAQQIVP